MSYPYSRLGPVILSVCGLAGCSLDHLKTVDGADSQVISDGASTPDTPTNLSDGGPAKRLFSDEASTKVEPKPERFVQEGTGRVVGQPPLLASDSLVIDDVGDITLNVVDADIREVVRLVLEDGLNANYVIDPAVTGSTTIRTSRPVPAGEILPLLSSVLQANGAALVEKEGVYHVLPQGQAAVAGGNPNTRLSLRAGGVRSGALLAPLRYAKAGRLSELLQPFIAGNGSVQVDAERNTLLITGSADQIATMNDLIDLFDVDWIAGRSIGFYPLERVQPSDLALELEQIFSTGEEARASGEPLRFLPIDRLRAMLVIANEPAMLTRVESWIDRLDKIGDGDEDQIFVYAVQNGRASDLAAVLGELFEVESTAIGPDPLLAPELEPIELRSSLLSEDSDSDRDEDDDRFAADRDFGSARDRRSEFAAFDPRNLTEGPEDVATKIVADEANNSLLIRAKPRDYRKIESAIRELDRPPLQVLLEATIAEVTLRDELSYGIQWFFNTGRTDFTLSETDATIAPFFPGFSGILTSGDVEVVIDALETVSDVNIVSSPQVLVLDNQTAQLEVGDEVPIITRQSESVEDVDAPIVSTVEQRQTGVILNVTPRVNASGLVVLDIRQEVSDVVATTTSGIDSPTISQRRIGTTVAVDSEQTVALGGLIEEDVDEIRSGIPYLSTLPYIGWLFGSTTTSSERTELLVLITPKVLADTKAAVVATSELKKRLRAAAPLQEKIAPRNDDLAGVDAAVPGPAAALAAPVSDDGIEDRYVVQLASLGSEARAEATWQIYREKYSGLIDGFPYRIWPTVRGDDTIFGLQVGPITSFKRANDLCDHIKADGDDCLVIKTGT